MKKREKDNQKELHIVPRKPSALLYWILVPVAKFLARAIFRIKIDKDPAVKKLKTPFIAIGTHSCAMDVSFMMTALVPRRLNIVCGRDVFTWKPVKPIARIAGLLPISQFAMDISSIRLMKRSVDAGCSLAFFPEGKISLDGRPMHYLSPSLAKLLKFLDVPVIMCHNNGGYSSRPKWFKKYKRGEVRQTVRLLLTAEQIRAMPVDEIHACLKEAFAYNDHAFQRENNIRYRSKMPALGLHYILYKCPKCGIEYENESTETQIKCRACGNTVTYTEYGELLPEEGSVAFEGVDFWYDFERAAVREEVEKEDFFVSHPVVWEVSRDNIYYENGEGDLYINRESIGFTGKDLTGKPVEYKIPLKSLFTIVQKTKEAVDLTIDGVVNRFYFREGRYSVKYTLAVEESFKRIHNL